MSMRPGVRTTIDKTAGLLDALLSLPRTQVLVGVPADHTNRDNGDVVTNATLAYIHNYGAPEANIPARPFMEPGIKNVKAQIVNYFRQAGKFAMEGNKGRVTRALMAAGETASSSVKAKIETGPFEPLKPSTIYARQHRKVAPRSGDKPLIDLGEMQRSITYILRNK